LARAAADGAGERMIQAMWDRVNSARLTGLYLVICGIWGTTWFAMQKAVATLPPMTAAGLRFSLAFPFLAVILWRIPGKSWTLPKRSVWLLPFVTVCYIIVPYTLINIGEQHVDSGLAAILFSSVTVFLLVFSKIISKTRVSLAQWIAVIAGLICLVFLIISATGQVRSDSVLAPMAILAAAVLHSLTYAVLGRFGKDASVLTLEALPVGIGGAILLILGEFTEHPRWSQVSASSWLAVIYLAVVASVIGFGVYFYLVQRMSPLWLSFVFIFFPIIAVGVSIAAGQARLRPVTVLLGAGALACFAITKRLEPSTGGESLETDDELTRHAISLLTPGMLSKLCSHAVNEYPRECCGFVLDDDVRMLRNAADEYHKSDPDEFSRTTVTGFALDCNSVLFLERSFEGKAPVRILYHSHPNGKAYFSKEDLRRSVIDGTPVYPDLRHLVIGVDDAGPQEARLYVLRGETATEVASLDLTMFAATGLVNGAAMEESHGEGDTAENTVSQS
jgi:drug/metabolite transporter (DMT)-like permease/proteasome lid subunit RPN8/RPN11